ncbi:S-adenosyl-L-methionine-dependent methyltransferase [Glarea lozoyensis ATCC 20868]|uniref:Protein arginine methyltransferase NDUFAF7 n=1 Tax=Glarea lozoyensis (strain ATCC 20868 / MF5171) TaxID=1116229 RepID=S3DDW8_GLAL2|nr:S-adenosyl-L-methionine-dependent methyltransferase [Glarea lozoyensis ATCC 20868]EPE30186.1 S-adenosyl-L-methionine-dependent methyltransferase [Glarea lozoyensis ATCC 20868]
MKTVIAAQARLALHNAAKRKCRAPSWRGVRWSSSESKQWSTPLAKQLSEAITATGPVPLASFMRMCLTSDVGGYYTSSLEGRDQFGTKGDFITSPEISQIFGELIGVWFVAQWMAQGKKKEGIEFIEIGPGRGTLMDDILRTIRNFEPMGLKVDNVYMVEASASLRDAQKKLLCGDAEMKEIDIGHESTSKYSAIPVVWTDNIRFIPSGQYKSPFIVAHEFFDALPIHAFQSIPPPPQEPVPDAIQTPTGTHTLAPNAPKSKSKQPTGPQWRELVVSPTPPPASPTDKKEEFQLTLSKQATPHSMYLPVLSSRYKSLLQTPGNIIEISPESQAYASAIATRIGGSSQDPKATPSGAALILDYGTADTVPINSLRGIKEHKRVSPFEAPGLVDLSADVDFIALAEAALKASPGIEVHGPVEQGAFLEVMGIKERAEMLVKSIEKSAAQQGSEKLEEMKKGIDGAWRRLVDRSPVGMGKVYKVMAITPENRGKKIVGFGGDV